METLSGIGYDTPVGTADFARADAAAPTVAVMYASVAAALAALNAAGMCAVEVPSKGADGRAIRFDLSCGIRKAAGAGKVVEDVYLISPAGLDGKEGIVLERACTLLWDKSSTAIDATLGGRTGHCWPQTVTITNRGLLNARVQVEEDGYNQVPTFATIYDIGPSRGLIRVARLNTADPADGFGLISKAWR